MMRILSLSALLLATAALVGCGGYTTVVIVKSSSAPTANADATASAATPAAHDSSSDVDAANLDPEQLISDRY